MRGFSLSLLIVPMLIISGCSMMNDFGEFSFGQEQGSLDGGGGGGNGGGGNDGGSDSGGDSDGGNGGNNGGNNGPMVDGGNNGGTDAGPPVDPICAAAACDPVAICNSSTGVAVCACPMGYIDMNGDGTVCRDVNECKAGIDACDEHSVCENTAGSYKCNCNIGFFFDKVSNTCIDDCIVLVSTVCDEEALCLKPDGYGVCRCPFGFKDVSAAKEGSQCEADDDCAGLTCDTLALCDTTGASPVCKCPDGYSGNGTTCTDVNECASNNGGCNANASCTNTAGGRICECKDGFTGDGVSCTDIDECASAEDNNCDKTNGTCANTAGAFTCGCKTGFSPNADKTVCTDIDECAAGACAAGTSICTNTAGSHSCRCKDGYTGDGNTCADVNECNTNNGNCGTGVVCSNSPGSYECGCGPGMRKNQTGACVDINECAENLANCNANATCANVVVTPSTTNPTFFTCACKTGYVGDGVTCNDENECLSNNGGCAPAPTATCTNQPGAPRTCACNNGYTGNGLTCAVIDRCATNNGGCSANANCTNNIGADPTCTCKTGFTGNGISCTDINECTLNTDNCDPLPDACVNASGSFSCVCPPGYSGTGVGANGCCTPDSNTDTSQPNDGKDNECDGFIDRPVLDAGKTFPAPDGVSSGAAVQIVVNPSAATALVPTLQCRTYKRSTTPTNSSWGTCANPIIPFTALASANPANDGAWRTDVRWRYASGALSHTTSHDYYVHSSLNGATKCSPLLSDSIWFAKAAERLLPPNGDDPGAWATTEYSLKKPFVRVTYNTPLSSRFGLVGGPSTQPMLSLRHRFTMRADRKLLLITRDYVKRSVNPKTQTPCAATYLDVHDSNFSPFTDTNFVTHRCDAVVLNRAGVGVCLQAGNGTAFFANTHVEPFANAIDIVGTPIGWNGASKFMWRQIVDDDNFSPKCETSGCDGIFIPDRAEVQ